MGDTFPIEFEIFEVTYLPQSDWKKDKTDFFAERPKRDYFGSLDEAISLAREFYLLPTNEMPDIPSQGDKPIITKLIYTGNVSLNEVMASLQNNILPAQLTFESRTEINYVHPQFKEQ